MSAQQLRLLAPAKPLLERFGADFFRAVPPRPGVYLMGDHSDRVLYIGQSKNLRLRLASYKNAQPQCAPRKLIRLVHQVRTLVWEECPTPEAARLKENELLRLHRPHFNVVNTWPQAGGFIALRAGAAGLTFHFAHDPKLPGHLFGAFKSGCLRAAGALLRLLWTAWHQAVSAFDLPAPLLREKPPREYSLPFPGGVSSPGLAHWLDLLTAFFNGESGRLLTDLMAAIPAPETGGVFQKNFIARDLELAAEFFTRGPQRNRDLCRRHGLPIGLLAPAELDDLLALQPRPHPPAPHEPARLPGAL